jgi:DNA polymerase III epsilon subunit-like protein
MFSSLVRTPKGIPPLITDITVISNEMVATARGFEEVGKNFLRFLKEISLNTKKKMKK